MLTQSVFQMDISVVIPTYNRINNVLSLLKDINRSTLPVKEVIIVDGGTRRITQNDLQNFNHLNIQLLHPLQASVCIQRNMGIRTAAFEWIFLCDDDMEIPATYLQEIANFSNKQPDAKAISGQIMQRIDGIWKPFFPVLSCKELLIKYIFGLSIWGGIECKANNMIMRRIHSYYQRKGNHLAASGWPVLTEMSGDCFTVPVFGLCAGVIQKNLLLDNPYNESLDRHGIGDHYGVTAGFYPVPIHILNNTRAFNHHESEDRLQRPLQYYRRVLALDYFSQSKSLKFVINRRSLLWSLIGNTLLYLFNGDTAMTNAAAKAFFCVAARKNPYIQEHSNTKGPGPIEPML